MTVLNLVQPSTALIGAEKLRPFTVSKPYGSRADKFTYNLITHLIFITAPENSGLHPEIKEPTAFALLLP